MTRDTVLATPTGRPVVDDYGRTVSVAVLNDLNRPHWLTERGAELEPVAVVVPGAGDTRCYQHDSGRMVTGSVIRTQITTTR